MKKKNEYDLPLEPGKNQIHQKGKMKSHLKYSLLERVCNSQLDCIKDYQASMDNLVAHMDFVMKQNEEIWKERNDAVRAYNGMILSKQTAEQMGIDTDAMATPEQKEFMEKYQFVQKVTVTEAGKTHYKYILTPKKKEDN